jgi:hypothetical protein
MAFGLLDGTNGNINISITPNLSNGSAGSAVNGNTSFGMMTIHIGATLAAQDVFATGAWDKDIKTKYSVTGRVSGFVSTGLSISDPLVLVTAPGGPLAVVATFQTGCALTMSANFFGDDFMVVATQNSARGCDFKAFGAVTSAWVVS